MGERKLTKAELLALSHLASGDEVNPVDLARGMGVRRQARGTFCGTFRRLYVKGAASIRVTRDAAFYRITDAGRSALEASK